MPVLPDRMTRVFRLGYLRLIVSAKKPMARTIRPRSIYSL
jgi:hypothetical protein